MSLMLHNEHTIICVTSTSQVQCWHAQVTFLLQQFCSHSLSCTYRVSYSTVVQYISGRGGFALW